MAVSPPMITKAPKSVYFVRLGAVVVPVDVVAVVKVVVVVVVVVLVSMASSIGVNSSLQRDFFGAILRRTIPIPCKPTLLLFPSHPPPGIASKLTIQKLYLPMPGL